MQILETEFNLRYISIFHSYRAVNTFLLDYKNMLIVCRQMMSLCCGIRKKCIG
jgi:hypothetical protein